MDDFFAILSPMDDIWAYAQHFFQLCDDLGLQINHDKELMGTTNDFLGVESESILMQAPGQAGQGEKHSRKPSKQSDNLTSRARVSD